LIWNRGDTFFWRLGARVGVIRLSRKAGFCEMCGDETHAGELKGVLPFKLKGEYGQTVYSQTNLCLACVTEHGHFLHDKAGK